MQFLNPGPPRTQNYTDRPHVLLENVFIVGWCLVLLGPLDACVGLNIHGRGVNRSGVGSGLDMVETHT